FHNRCTGNHDCDRCGSLCTRVARGAACRGAGFHHVGAVCSNSPGKERDGRGRPFDFVPSGRRSRQAPIYTAQGERTVNARNKFFIILGIIFAISLGYYLFSTPRGSDLDLIGTVDANQIIVSPQTAGRISKLLVDEGTQVKQGDLIATLDPSELEAQARAAAATIDALRSQVAATQATSEATQGSTTSSVANAQARLESTRAQLVQAEATLQRVESDSRRAIELAKQG